MPKENFPRIEKIAGHSFALVNITDRWLGRKFSQATHAEAVNDNYKRMETFKIAVALASWVILGS